MFLSHFGVAFAAKKIAPKISLGTLVLGCQLMDLVWPMLVLLGIEKVSVQPGATAYNYLNFESYPYSHSLVGSLLLSALAAIVYFLVNPKKLCAVILGAVVFSHWILDYISHRPDLPITDDLSQKVGLGLWNSIPATVFVELLFFFVGVFIYLKSYPPKTTARKIGLAVFAAFLLTIFGFASFGPPPPSEATGIMIAAPALAMWIFVPWAMWIDRDN
ncbi:hypothetical protein [Bdellovibrio reynosensis]|uniref:Metal-dependent hydrolase n=1 Tax=Bdellovibrio reynosensis TaxID=2835041 RepID=A0ABY4C6M3_9BACT|nr:hypothetical protein [Bdellovibrio reynosensis]UOF00597.1 hypothetical protein MNR06_12905 [Bdellovibrio reynosensis]